MRTGKWRNFWQSLLVMSHFISCLGRSIGADWLHCHEDFSQVLFATSLWICEHLVLLCIISLVWIFLKWYLPIRCGFVDPLCFSTVILSCRNGQCVQRTFVFFTVMSSCLLRICGQCFLNCVQRPSVFFTVMSSCLLRICGQCFLNCVQRPSVFFTVMSFCRNGLVAWRHCCVNKSHVISSMCLLWPEKKWKRNKSYGWVQMPRWILYSLLSLSFPQFYILCCI